MFLYLRFMITVVRNCAITLIIDGVKNSVHMHGGGIGLDAQYKGFFAETKLAFAGKNGDLADVRKDKQWWLKVGYQF